ncbi:hypothetical protein F7734_22405 [Scytonema sp. UIC 10036]|uniref:hypothetical protein n=1 Tax=Scytonema sp. UIC 10036 TaxID=2304196 RepID=UPI0012DA88AE|nr:hypothetical protein [Scytonema sp. UIC 10036]MUG94964.1 hypothetical protein [Scytonema sp. UIC 10036]
MNRKIALWSLWAGFIAYVLFLAPPLHLEETLTLLKNIFTLNWSAINPVVLSIFALVGILLLIYSGVLFFDGRMQWIPFWPFALAGVGAGILGILPYLAFREPNQEFAGQKDSFLNFLDSRLFGIVLTLSTLPILGYAFVLGDWTDFWQQFRSDRFINGMSLAVCLFCLLFPTVLGDEMARRRLDNPPLFWTVAFVPLIGSLAYLCLRPPILENNIARHRQTTLVRNS